VLAVSEPRLTSLAGLEDERPHQKAEP
jgi:hypothetical protein